MKFPPGFLAFVRKVHAWHVRWDERTTRFTRQELADIFLEWNEHGPGTCDEAVAMIIRQVYPTAEQMRQLVHCGR